MNRRENKELDKREFAIQRALKEEADRTKQDRKLAVVEGKVRDQIKRANAGKDVLEVDSDLASSSEEDDDEEDEDEDEEDEDEDDEEVEDSEEEDYDDDEEDKDNDDDEDESD